MYNVVFEYIKGGAEGSRFRTGYSSKEEFDIAQAKITSEDRITKVVAEGISDDESLALCEEASARSYEIFGNENIEIINHYIDMKLNELKHVMETGEYPPVEDCDISPEDKEKCDKILGNIQA